MSQTWFISDTHFRHENIGRYCNRPEGWEERIWKNLESVVGPEDTLCHVGDVCLCSKAEMGEIVDRLPGRRLVLIEGNHDKRNKTRRHPRWDKVVKYHETVRWLAPGAWWPGEPEILVTHRPQDVPADPPVSIVLTGHIHDIGPPFQWSGGRLYVNLCVEQWDYWPVSLAAILKIYGSRASK